MVTNDVSASMVELSLALRRKRASMFDPIMFNEAAWDMLLVLYLADAMGERITGIELIARLQLSPEIGKRWLAYLSHSGQVVGDGNGHPEELVTLSAASLQQMEAFFGHARSAFSKLSEMHNI